MCYSVFVKCTLTFNCLRFYDCLTDGYEKLLRVVTHKATKQVSNSSIAVHQVKCISFAYIYVALCCAIFLL